ncbi:MAG: hypothetical protein D6819_05600 [Gammaproteobacteria bacterium]|nr:MAG: hypothetical protein D6819_05600 [Gammaproteobacteria bacterium]
MSDVFSEAMLNAYVDGELDGEEARALLEAASRDPALEKRIRELQRLKGLIRGAYELDGPCEPLGREVPLGGSILFPWAAAAMLALGVLGGWMARGWLEGPPLEAVSVATLPSQGLQKVILHIDSNRPERLDAALDDAEQLLAAAARERRRLQLEIIANAGGIELLKADREAYARRIRELLRRYDSVTFLACSNALARLRERGVEVDLLPEVKVAPSAVDQIVKRLKAGWVYIKV